MAFDAPESNVAVAGVIKGGGAGGVRRGGRGGDRGEANEVTEEEETYGGREVVAWVLRWPTHIEVVIV